MSRPATLTLVLSCLVFAPAMGVAYAHEVGPNAQPAAMTNADVIKMISSGLSAELVSAAIRQAGQANFDTSADALIALVTAGVSEEVIGVILERSSPRASEPPAPAGSAASLETNTADPPDLSDPTEPHPAGIYVLSEGELTELEPTVYTGARSGGRFLSALTMGIKQAQWKAVVRSPVANQRVLETVPTFYFYFEETSSGLSNTSGFQSYFASATSPNEFILTRMTRKRSEREVVVGEFGLYRESIGPRSEDTVDMAIDRISPGIYKVQPVQPLEIDAEYAFLHGGSLMVGPGGIGSQGRLFDFGVGLR